MPKEAVATSRQDAVGAAEGMGLPVVLKIVFPDILYEIEASSVIVDVSSAQAVADGYETILANTKRYKADARIDGVQIQ